MKRKLEIETTVRSERALFFSEKLRCGKSLRRGRVELTGATV